ncbi:MAG: response regulator [Burkholderiales bacterium]|nr:response regulator [Burkholderiales bacterium]
MTGTAPLILFVDDEASAVKYFQRAIDSLAPVIAAGSVEEGKRMLDQHADTLSVLVSDQRMPGGCGNELLHYARTQYPHMVRILSTAYSELEQTVEAVNQGQIHRYIQKPWEISALRMELKQALEMAALRKEHAQLLREKMMVRQMQTVSNRIGMLHTLCVSLAGTVSPLENYLSAAAIAGIKPSEPDWLLMDYSDLVSAEAWRSGEFGYAVHGRLVEIRQRSLQGEDGFALLPELDCNVRVLGDGTAVFPGGEIFAEFLEAPSNVPVSPQHVTWLAFLIWLHELGWSLQMKKSEIGIECRLEASVQPVSPARMAAWIEQFYEGN